MYNQARSIGKYVNVRGKQVGLVAKVASAIEKCCYRSEYELQAMRMRYGKEIAGLRRKLSARGRVISEYRRVIAKVKDIINKTVAEALLQKLETPQGGLEPRRT